MIWATLAGLGLLAVASLVVAAAGINDVAALLARIAAETALSAKVRP